MQQRFIEYDLPLAEISEESVREKNINHGHPSALHVWWARRPLASSQATTLAALLDDPGPHEPEKRREIRELIKEITPWEAVKNGNSEAIYQKQRLEAIYTPVQREEVYSIIRRRLFEQPDEAKVRSAIDRYVSTYQQHKKELPTKATAAASVARWSLPIRSIPR